MGFSPLNAQEHTKPRETSVMWDPQTKEETLTKHFPRPFFLRIISNPLVGGNYRWQHELIYPVWSLWHITIYFKLNGILIIVYTGVLLFHIVSFLSSL